MRKPAPKRPATPKPQKLTDFLDDSISLIREASIPVARAMTAVQLIQFLQQTRKAVAAGQIPAVR